MLINSSDLKLQPSNSVAIKLFEICAKFQRMSGREQGGRFAPRAIRLRAIRRASPWPNRGDFATALGITVSRLSNVENGFPIGSDLQNKIVEKCRWVNRAYLMDGDESSLTGATLQRLLPLIEEESDTTAPRRRSPSRSKAGRR